MSEPRLLLSIEDLDDAAIETILTRARALAAGQPPHRLSPVVALVFLAASTRTRLGFGAATARMGGVPIDLAELRTAHSMSAAESFADTIRTVSGMVDAVVLRTDHRVERDDVVRARCPVISGGHGDEEHPTQALIDFAAIEADCGPVDGLRVTICGDLGMRAVRSLLRLFVRRPPAEIILVAPRGRDDPGVDLPPSLQRRVRRASPNDLPATDVLYLPGLPERHAGTTLGAAERRPYTATPRLLESLATDGVVLSPLPVVDEIDDEVRRDPRMRAFEQSDRGVHVRIAVLEYVLRR